jgi:hypothetical protein
MPLRSSQWAYERALLQDFPAPVVTLLKSGHTARLGQKLEPRDSPLALANRWLGEHARDLRRSHLSHAFDEQALRDAADNYSRLCSRMHSLAARRDFATYIGVSPPRGKRVSDDGAIARLNDPLWWRRALRKTWTRSAENGLRRIGLIRRGRDPYASEYAVRHRRAQRGRMRSYLEAHAAINEDNVQLSLLELAEHSLSNPALRRGEFMTRLRGFEELAQDHKHAALFLTLTAPSHFHAQLAKGGANPNYARAVVRDAQAWLCSMWARVRSKLRRLSIAVYGFRIAEPHHDATPHWHIVAFLPTSAVAAFSLVVSSYWLSEHGDEPGAREHRCRIETIDPEKGSACAYLAKYVAKNIDGESIADDEDFETGQEIADSIARVDAWASVHGIRQFQQIGGAAVGIWREARRLREPVDDRDIERARLAADAGDWRAFTYAASGDGLHAHRKTSLKLERVSTLERNRYGERRHPRIVGIRYASAVAITRPHSWRIERAGTACSRQRLATSTPEHAVPVPFFIVFTSPSSLGPVAITVRASSTVERPASARAGPTQ